MELRTLRYFVTVAEVLNITRAAEMLNMSQPPLSTQMKNLEAELDTVLFIRGKRQLSLTDSGKLLYRRAKEIINLTEKAEKEIISLKKGMTGTISLGLVEGMAPDIAGEWIAGFIQDHRNVHFRILDGNTDDLVEKLRSGLISLAVITSPFDQTLLNAFPVGSEQMVALMDQSHPLAQNPGDSLEIKDLKDESLIVPGRRATIDTIFKWFRQLHCEPKIICEMDSYLDAAALAGRKVGISIFPQTAYIPNDSLVAKNISVTDKQMDYFFVWRKGHPLPTAEESFIDFVRAAVLHHN